MGETFLGADRSMVGNCGQNALSVATTETAVRCGDSFPLWRTPRCVCASSSPGLTADGAHDRGNSALGTGARSDRRSVPRSKRGYQIHGLPVLAPKGREGARVFREAAWDGHRFSDAGEALPLHASDAIGPIAGRTVWTRPGNEQLPKWIRRDAIGPWPQTGESLTLFVAPLIPQWAWHVTTPPGRNTFSVGSLAKMAA